MKEDKNKSDKEWINKLRTGREELILSSLKELRSQGNDRILPEIMALLSKISSSEIQNEVIAMLSDLNNQSSVPIFMENISLHRKEKYFSRILGACWQNGLDYSSYLDYFIDIALEDDYECSLEAFTIIEGNITSLENDEREKMANYIAASKDKVPDEKIPLTEELETVVRPFSGPFKVDSAP